MRTITQQFLRTIEQYADRHGVPILRFEKGQRKEDLAAEYRKRSDGSEGLLFIGKAQEKVRTFRTEGRRNARGETYPLDLETTTLANQYYFYGLDDDFGPFFLKYSSYFPYGAKLCFNGHEYLKRQLAKEGIGFEEPRQRYPQLRQSRPHATTRSPSDPQRIHAFLRKWQAPLALSLPTGRAASRLPLRTSPCPKSNLALTQVLDRPVHGQIFEEIIRENLDLGRPDNIQLIFDRRVTKATPGPFRTRVVREGVIPSSCGLQVQRHQTVLQEGRRSRHGNHRPESPRLRLGS